jgi:hypothetical protein
MTGFSMVDTSGWSPTGDTLFATASVPRGAGQLFVLAGPEHRQTAFGTTTSGAVWAADGRSLLTIVSDRRMMLELRQLDTSGRVLRAYPHPDRHSLGTIVPGQGSSLAPGQPLLCAVDDAAGATTLQLLDLRTDTYKVVVGSEGRPRAGAYLPKGSRVVWCSVDEAGGEVHVTDVASGRDRVVYGHPEHRARWVFPGDARGDTVYLQIAETVGEPTTLVAGLSLTTGHFRVIRRCENGLGCHPAVSRDGSLVALSGWDPSGDPNRSENWLWDSRTRTLRSVFRSLRHRVLAFVFAPNGANLAALFEEEGSPGLKVAVEKLPTSRPR